MLRLFVSAEVDLPLEPLVAQPARKRLVPGVLPHVRYQVRGLAEGLVTYHALVGLLAWNMEE